MESFPRILNLNECSRYTGSYNYGSYGGDYGNDNKLCSLKYVKVCWGDLYTDLILAGVKFCKKNDAFAQFSTLIKDLFSHGKLYDQVSQLL